MNKCILTITGVSCSGKSTLASDLCRTGHFVEIVSTTTRPMRFNERNGVNYHFVSPEEFENIEMLESTTYGEHSYGASVSEVEEKFNTGKIPVVVVDPHGLSEICNVGGRKGWHVVNVFVDCPTATQCRRIFDRFAGDYRQVLGQSSIEQYTKLLRTYTNRMVAITNTEYDWMEKFLFLKTRHYYTISLYDKASAPKHIEHIRGMTKKLTDGSV